MRKKQKRKERARIATFIIMGVSILLAVGSLAISDMKKAGKYNTGSESQKTISETDTAPAGSFSVATASAHAAR